MTTKTAIASRTLGATDANGRTFDLTIGIGHPYEITANEWACPVRLDGLHERLRDMHGADSWQAMQLAYQLIAQLLGYFIEDGGRLFWLGEGEERVEVFLNELIPHLRTPEIGEA